MKYFNLIFIGLCFSSMVNAQEVTYANNIADMIYTHCSSCHRPGEIGPFSLTNYQEVKDWGASIKFVTQNKIMPPWKPDPSYARYLGENFLSQQQIDDLSNWVDNGMERGDINTEPAFPDFPEGSILGEPDLVLTMSEAYLHQGNNQDNYRYFVLPSGLTEDKIIKTVEFRPGNPKIVHHALIFEDNTGQAAAKDAATSEYGFNGFGSFLDGDDEDILNQKQFPGFVPGQKPIFYPDGIGQSIKAGADVVIQVHYAPWPVDEFDQSSLNIFFADETEVIEREVETHIMVPFGSVIGEVFVIPANTQREFHGIWNVPKDVSFIGLTPHMHLLGQHWEVYLEHPDGRIENLIRINEWDFNWQGGYSFNKYITAKAGTKVHAIASYDNTSNNPNNPSNPPKFATWGEGTEDEMYYLPLNFVDYQEGDEDIVFEELVSSTNQLNQTQLTPIEVSPNPIDDFGRINFSLQYGETINIDLLSIEGKVVRQLRKGEFFQSGNHTITLNSKHIESGQYLVRIYGNNHSGSALFIKH